MTFVALLIVAWQCGRLLPVSLLPDVDIPEISVHLSLPNASARELEQTAVKMLREQLLQLNGLRQLESEARHESAFIKMQLEYGVDSELAFMEVNEKIDQAMIHLPREMERPRVIRASASDLPVLYLNLMLKDTSAFGQEALKWLEFSNFTRQVIRRRLEQLPELALVDVSGYSEAEAYIIPDEEKMQSLQINQEFIQRIIRDNNIKLGNILVRDRQYQYHVQLDFQLQSIEDIRHLYFKISGQVLQLKDIAEVGLRQQDLKGMCLADQEPSISVAIIKQSRARMDDLEIAVRRLINSMEQEYPDIRFELSQNQAQLLRLTIQNLQQSLVMGCLVVVLIMFVFMRNWKAPLIVGISVPVALMISLILFYLLGISINIISLSGLIMGVGLMIDNAVIVVDNIDQERARGQTLEQACIQGAGQVVGPLIASAMTTCVIFLPLVFLSGMAGLLFYDQAIAIAIGLGVSLVVSLTLIPSLYRSVFLLSENSIPQETEEGRLASFYSKGVDMVLVHPWSSLFFILLFIGFGIRTANHLPLQLMPDLDKNEVMIDLHWNENLSLPESRRRMIALLRNFKSSIHNSVQLLGQSQYLLIKQGVSSTDEVLLYLQTQNANSLGQLEGEIRQYIQQLYPNARLQFRNSETLFDRIFPEEPILKAIISTKDLNESEQIDLLRRFRNSVGYPRSPGDLPATQELIELQISPEKLLLYDVSAERLYNRLKKALRDME